MYNEATKSTNLLEQFILLAKNAHGAAASQLIRQVTEYPGIFVFGELLEIPGISELEKSEFTKEWNLLQLFAYGTLEDYKAKQVELPELNEQQLRKLRLLTMATLAAESSNISYESLLRKLDLENYRQLEDLIIEGIYSDVIKGKINPKEKKLEIDYVIGRDIKANMIDNMIETLEKWCSNCENAIEDLDKEIIRANHLKDKRVNTQKNVEQEVESVKKAIKLHQQTGSKEVEPSSSSSSIMERMSVPRFKGFKANLKASSSRVK